MPSYYTADAFEHFGFKPAANVSDLAIVTVAGFVPGGFEITLCDECIAPVDFSRRPDFVGLTGKVTQWRRMREIADRFRALGVCVMIGGPYASLSPDVVRPHCDILVRGEIEDIAESLFADLEAGDWKSEYVGTKPDLSRSPRPRWDLYPNGASVCGSVQTSRGCPFECEFCDVIQYLGRKQRHKTTRQVLAELDELYRHGYRSVFLADDNFTVYRARAKELLAGLADWNRRQTDGPILFATQVSIDAAADEELLRMCADAGLVHVFIGIETPNEEALRIAKKRQNLRRDLASEILHFVEHGISVEAGMIVGFDGDDPRIFERQYEFAMRCAVPIFSLTTLNAPDATPLFARLKRDGRIVENGPEGLAESWDTNIVPLGMSREELKEGVRWLTRTIYAPEAFEARLDLALQNYGVKYRSSLDRRGPANPRPIDLDAVSLAFRIGELGSAEAALARRVFKRIDARPELGYPAIRALTHYAQVRQMYQELMRFEVVPLKSPSWATSKPTIELAEATTAR